VGKLYSNALSFHCTFYSEYHFDSPKGNNSNKKRIKTFNFNRIKSGMYKRSVLFYFQRYQGVLCNYVVYIKSLRWEQALTFFHCDLLYGLFQIMTSRDLNTKKKSRDLNLTWIFPISICHLLLRFVHFIWCRYSKNS
jgi:hypothetical protein